jgi:Transposase domain (DUF772)
LPLSPQGLFIAFVPNGSEAFKRTSPDWTHLWGEVHPNFIDDIWAARRIPLPSGMQIRFKTLRLRAQEVVVGQLGFFDLNRRYEGLNEKNDPLVAIAATVPFESVRPKLKAALIKGELRRSGAERKSPAGRKPWDEVVIFKALVLQALYNLSDDQAEYQLRDRLSFLRFPGLGLEDAVPDAKTLWLYREALAKGGAAEELFGLFDGF